MAKKAKACAVQAKSKVQLKSKGAHLKVVKAAPKKAAAKAAVAKVADAPKKEISQKLLETIERRKKESKPFGRIPGRRGRRPKNHAEYNPENGNEEESGYGGENDYEHLEYDTGIQVSKSKEDAGFSMDRFEEFDEELNFDW